MTVKWRIILIHPHNDSEMENQSEDSANLISEDDIAVCTGANLKRIHQHPTLHKKRQHDLARAALRSAARAFCAKN